MDPILQEDGFGETTAQELADLRKALEIGYTTPGGAGFDSLRVESLEATLKLLTYQATNLRLWNQIPKTDAYSTVEEYNRLLQYGSEGGGFVASGVLPEEEDSQYERADQKVKYLGTTRSVHHPATLVRTIPADLIGQETQNGAMWLMGKANQSLYFGNSDAVPLEWNGLVKQILDGSGHVIDLEGGALEPADLENVIQLIVDNFGQPVGIYSNSKVFTDFGAAYNTSQRFSAAVGINPQMAGMPVTGYQSLVGKVNFEPDVFVKRGSTAPAAATHAKAPSPPTLALGAPGADSASVFRTGDAGVYKWQVTAINQYGESLPCTLSGGGTLAAGEALTLTITDGGGTYPATAYRIYRTEKNGATAYYTNWTQPRSKSGGAYTATTTWKDLNEWRPRTFIALVLDMSVQSLTFRQLSPMIKMNLAQISPAIRWMQLLYGTPIVFAPKKNAIIKNIGVAS